MAKKSALVIGPLLSLGVLLFADLDPRNVAVTRTAAVAVLMAFWWITEAIPLAVTSLVPEVLFPLLGIMDGKAVATQYCNHIILLFIGGFMVALAMQRWDLHKRIALSILLLFGVRPRRILLGLMVATAFLSMWISNTATAMMMVTIVLAVLAELETKVDPRHARRLSTGLLLGVAYGASVGGIATLVGTPPNLSFARIFEIQFPDASAISFATWSAFALPISVILLAGTWLLLSVVFVPRDVQSINQHTLRAQRDRLGPMSYAERVVACDLAALVVLWLFRADIQIGAVTLPGWSRWLAYPGLINDGTVAIAMAIALFMVPARDTAGSRVLDWPTASKLPWSIVLLYGGGFALASAFIESGLSAWVGEQLKAAGSLPPYVLLAILCVAISFLTELTSNTATTEMILPILAGLSIAIKIDPLFLMVPVTISCSCAFMMPVATPPNAIVFGTQRLRVSDMARAGIVLNFLGAAVIVLVMYALGEAVLGIDPSDMPDWSASR